MVGLNPKMSRLSWSSSPLRLRAWFRVRPTTLRQATAPTTQRDGVAGGPRRPKGQSHVKSIGQTIRECAGAGGRWPSDLSFGHELTGYPVQGLRAILDKGKDSGLTILSAPYTTSDRTSAASRLLYRACYPPLLNRQARGGDGYRVRLCCRRSLNLDVVSPKLWIHGTRIRASAAGIQNKKEYAQQCQPKPAALSTSAPNANN